MSEEGTYGEQMMAVLRQGEAGEKVGDIRFQRVNRAPTSAYGAERASYSRTPVQADRFRWRRKDAGRVDRSAGAFHDGIRMTHVWQKSHLINENS
jgi:hypothetical protein